MKTNSRYNVPKEKQGLESNAYGVEKRTLQRRQQADRRECIRFEIDKPMRRSGNDRRNHHDIWQGYDKF